MDTLRKLQSIAKFLGIDFEGQTVEITATEAKKGILTDSTSPNKITGIWVGTQAQYDAITTKNSETLYMIQ